MAAENSSSNKLWGGRFTQKTATSVEDFTASVHYDRRLYRHDIEGSRAHAEMLADNGLLSEEELAAIVAGLAEIEAEIEAGTFTFQKSLEDIHMNIENALIARIGPAGAKLHSARSRNDQISLDLRLYLREQCDDIVALLVNLRRVLARLARGHLGVIMPGYTHLQRAQPVLLSHHLLAWSQMFTRDGDRLRDCRVRINQCPLGSAALAGSGLPIDREQVARRLEFGEITANSMDSAADRDFAIEFVSCCALIMTHLSRCAEELILWASSEFDFIEVSDRFCTGSSIMPQKKNPDIAELVRGKSGRVIGSLMSLLVLVKGLPFTYNRDLQEDKEQVFDAVDTVRACLSIVAELLAEVSFKKKRLARAAGSGWLTATDLADYLVLKEVPFREAHGIVGRIVAHCVERSCELTDMELADLRNFSPLIDKDVFEILTVEGSVDSRISAGGTSLARVSEALAREEQALGMTS